MTQSEVFGSAKWVGAGSDYGNTTEKDASGKPHFPILKSRITVKGEKIKHAVLRAIGLGFFNCRINGKSVSEYRFMPLATDYEPRENVPSGEILTSHRIWVPEFDVTSLLKSGKNILALHFGGGWYTFDATRYGDAKAIFRLCVETEFGTEEFISSENDIICDSYVKTYYFTRFEAHDYADVKDDIWTGYYGEKASLMPSPETEYGFCDCPYDRAESSHPALLYNKNGVSCYDAGTNISGYPVLKITESDRITVRFFESLKEDGTPDEKYNHGQYFTADNAKLQSTVSPEFTWFGFRYFTVSGNAEVVSVEKVHSDVKVSSEFRSDNAALNWLYDAYINTQLCNMHAGLPSDCPHLERRGYTGDGQLTCNAVMTVLDSRSFYHKWIYDISDCQDRLSGHVQYTAPYSRCGGGPGGWGCAIVEVPYQYYRHYGDISLFEKLYPQMLRYLDYLEAHSVCGLVSSDKEGEWCLGDWCCPEKVILPAAFVNNYFYIKCLKRMSAMAPLINKAEDAKKFTDKISERQKVTSAAYFNTWDGNFIGCMQGANAFAVDMGIGDTRTYENLRSYYKKLGMLDTGIFGTEAVLRVLFEHGDGELALSLMASTKDGTFDHWRRLGATTLWEYWPNSEYQRSLSHPMFGSPTAYLFEYAAGIHEDADGTLTISPVLSDVISKMYAKRTVRCGEVSVSYEKSRASVKFKVCLPSCVNKVRFLLCGTEKTLLSGENEFTVSL